MNVCQGKVGGGVRKFQRHLQHVLKIGKIMKMSRILEGSLSL